MTLSYATSIFYLTLGILILLIGIIIVKENIRQRVNRITGMMMFYAGMGPIFAACGILFESTDAAITLSRYYNIFLIWEFFFPQMLIFSFVFPREIDWAKKHPTLLRMIFLPHVVHFLLVFLFTSPEQISRIFPVQALVDRFGIIVQPLAILLELLLFFIKLIYEFHTNFFALVNLLYIITAIVIMMMSYKALTNLRLKKQVALVLWGIRASVGLYAIAFIFPKLHILQTSELVGHLLVSLALLIGTGSIAWAIVRYQFMDIRLIIRRGLVFSMSTALLVGVYLLIYNQGKNLIHHVFKGDLPVLEILFIILALLLFQPILSLLEGFIEKIFIRDRLDYRNVLKDLSHDILTTLDSDELKIKINRTLKTTMALEVSEIIMANPDGSFFLEKNGHSLAFHSNEEWIDLIKEENGPIGFDELSIRVQNMQALETLRVIDPYLLIPLSHRERLVGILVLGEKITKTRFTTEEMTILSVLSSQTAIALENANLYQETLEKQRMQEELNLAKEIQQNLLPSIVPGGDHYELAGYNLPSKEVGGDYYDFIPIDEQRIGIAIGDISGKGIPAAILMSNLQAALRVSASQMCNTDEVMVQVNHQILQTTSPEKYATFFYGVLDSQNLNFEYTNAGHNYPILWRDQNEIQLLKEGGVIIGVLKQATFASKKIKLKKGDLLVMYTDGITEAINPEGEEFGESRLMDVVKQVAHQSAQSVLDTILDAVVDFTHDHLQFDDLTLVTLKIK